MSVPVGVPVVVGAAAPPAGMVSFCPTFSLVGTTPGFAASSALSVTWLFLAILPSVSPFITTYSDPVGSGTDGVTTGGTTTAGGALVETTAGGAPVVTMGGDKLVS